MNSPYNPEGLWMKARLFINRAMDDDREFEESAFWAVAAIELLGKAALARVSPLLIAMPTDDGKSLLIASGLQPDSSGFLTVQAKAVYSRCQRAFRPFNGEEATKLSVGRNEYIHSAGIGFDAISEQAWWPRFWAQATILISHLDRDLSDLVGGKRAEIVEAFLATNQRTTQRRLEALVERAKSRQNQRTNGTLSAKLTAEWDLYKAPLSMYWTEAECPACGSLGWLGGDEKLEAREDTAAVHTFDEVTPIITLVVASDVFSCPNCHLTLDDWNLISEAGLDSDFETEGDISDMGYDSEYNNE